MRARRTAERGEEIVGAFMESPPQVEIEIDLINNGNSMSTPII
jgi:hypothetical protein